MTKKNSKTITANNFILWINIAFLSLGGILVSYYVVMANSITANNYKIQNLRNEIEVLTGENSSLISEKMVMESPSALLEFAQNSNLVEADNVVYIFESKNVAKR